MNEKESAQPYLKKISILLIVLVFLSCNVYYDRGFFFLTTFPSIDLKNSSDKTITVESYYFNKVTEEDTLWKKQEILPGEKQLVMDWVYPKKLIVLIADEVVFDYSGKNDKLLEDKLLSGNIVCTYGGEDFGDEEKYKRDNIPFDQYDFSWLEIREDETCFGCSRIELVFSGE